MIKLSRQEGNTIHASFGVSEERWKEMITHFSMVMDRVVAAAESDNVEEALGTDDVLFGFAEVCKNDNELALAMFHAGSKCQVLEDRYNKGCGHEVMTAVLKAMMKHQPKKRMPES